MFLIRIYNDLLYIIVNKHFINIQNSLVYPYKLHFTPLFKDPLIFPFWTFLDILKMSIFENSEEIFFGRTEKSGTQLMNNFVSIFSAKLDNGFLQIFGFLDFWVCFLDIFYFKIS